jgi:penicillin-binding protein 2
MTESKTRSRMKVLAFLVVMMFAAITTRLWFLQVLASQQFTKEANQNQVRLVPIEPIRGQILDRHGNVLVGNRPSTVVLLDKNEMGRRSEEVLYRLSNLLHIPTQNLVAQLNSVKYLPYQPIPVAEDVPQQAIFYLEEHHDEFPGVSYEVDPLRSYSAGSEGAQLLGYLGQVTSNQLADPAFRGNLPGELVGQSGVEAAYEHYLHGVNGTREIQVNAQGLVLDPNFAQRAPTPGDNVVLSIDQHAQQVAERSLTLGIQLARHQIDPTSGRPYAATGGAALVMDPHTGQILAMASNPTYDPSVFLGGLSHSEARQLFAASANNPLLNRATQGLYPAGSTFKPFIAVAALKERFINQNSQLNCPAQWAVPTDPTHPFHNWNPVDSGYISLSQALTISCDTYFYQLGYDFWLRYHHSAGNDELMQRNLGLEGFGHLSGIDLPGEQPGIIPTAQYEERVYRSHPSVYGKFYGWLPGDSVNLSIGQGYLQVTPLQIADAYCAIANGGTLYEPHVASRIQASDGRIVKTFEPEVMGHLPISQRQATALRNDLTNVPRIGTAASAFLGFPLDRIPVAGKTGTADIIPKQPVSWFAGMAPASDPKYVVVVMVEQGGHGAATAAPIARRIFEGLFGLQSAKLQAGQVAD